MNIVIDTSDLNKGIERLLGEAGKANKKGMSNVAEEIMRLSGEEVPLGETAILQDSGQVEPGDDEYIVGYNCTYAAYQHEGQRKDGTHVVRHYSNTRSKRKFLEDPIKNNIDTLLEHYARAMGGMF